MSSKLSDRLKVHVQRPEYRPQSKSELARALDLDQSQRRSLREAIRQLERQGDIFRTKRRRYARADTPAPKKKKGKSAVKRTVSQRSKNSAPVAAQGYEEWTPQGGSDQGKRRSSGDSKKRSERSGQKERNDQRGGTEHRAPEKKPNRSRQKGRSGSRSDGGSSHARGGKQPRSRGNNVIAGTLTYSERFGAEVFIDREDPLTKKADVDLGNSMPISIGKRDVLNALPGDRVAVRVYPAEIPAWKRKKMAGKPAVGPPRLGGSVVEIIERVERKFVGKFCKRGKFLYIKPDLGMLPPTVELSSVPRPVPKHLDKVVFELDSWESPNSLPRGYVTRILGKAGDPGVDILSIIHAHGLRDVFPPAVIKEVEGYSPEIDQDEAKKREDWRKKYVFTIDPADAKDFDDAICVTEDDKGGWELAVHIADVSHYVKSGSELDREAQVRGNSTYLVDRVIPMLPEELSNGLCSLKPRVDRLTRGAVIRFDKNGKQIGCRFFKGVICSAHRLSYEEAYDILVDKKADLQVPINRAVKDAWRLASMLRKARFAKGSLELDFPEVKVVVDDNGVPTGMKRIDYDESHQLIEEFMLVANESVARELKKTKKATVYRVHEEPDEEKLMSFAELVRAHGYKLTEPSNKLQINKVIKESAGRPEENAVKLALLKSMKRAAYHKDPLGHYGLAKENYTHFTSPIRRYADLLVHRALFDEKGRPDYAKLGEIARHISTTERTSAMAEKETIRLKEMEYFANLLEKDPKKTFPATVMEVRQFGVFLELDELMIRGLARNEHLAGGPWSYDGGRAELRGGKRRLSVGSKLKVRIHRVDMVGKQLDFRGI